MGRKKNRKKESRGFSFPAPFAAMLAVATVVALSYLWLFSRCEALGARIKGLEEKKTELHKRVLNEEYKLSSMKSPRNIEALMKRHNLAMSWPRESQIVRLRFQAGATVERTVAVRNDYARAGQVND
ncbi:MAG TPA: hypothetical protein DCZ95_05415 [Verrucomicrobia bacterium]|nr:MAG: hypothetical protein A2X46_10290 [Lentisphaerae bacterium GWF2_57_35]HBA83517.1 hypothetical protein [Verrucomicrobiota bacterium]